MRLVAATAYMVGRTKPYSTPSKCSTWEMLYTYHTHGLRGNKPIGNPPWQCLSLSPKVHTTASMERDMTIPALLWSPTSNFKLPLHLLLPQYPPSLLLLPGLVPPLPTCFTSRVLYCAVCSSMSSILPLVAASSASCTGAWWTCRGNSLWLSLVPLNPTTPGVVSPGVVSQVPGTTCQPLRVLPSLNRQYAER
jgi:hypothetical protein